MPSFRYTAITAAGETARGVIEALGVSGPVRSPTDTLVETYPVGERRLHHLDWYRLGGLDDLDGIGFRELRGPGQWLLVEWPEQVPEAAALADLAVRLDYAGAGRRLSALAHTPQGNSILQRWRTYAA